ncbi:hypothetical protein ACFOU2_01580 [Bacillus songklensis]|uniref:Uncharacterized protein n=1 Tax=Bacillus songklensis TaxID=1069116 RepID=A0ABV8AWB8_9BACI
MSKKREFNQIGEDIRSVNPQGLTNDGGIPDGFSREVSLGYGGFPGIDELQRKDEEF